MKQKIIGYVDMEDKQFKERIDAQLFIDGIGHFQTMKKGLAKSFANVLSLEGKKMRVYKIVLQKVK